MPARTTPKYNVCLIGSGGVGTIASIVLTKSKQAQVTVVLRSKYAYVSEHGWQVDSVDHGQLKNWKPHRVVGSAIDASTNDNGDAVEFDYLVVCTKQLPDKYSVADMIAPAMTAGKTSVVLIQNGMGIEEEIIKTWPTNAVISSVSHIGSSVTEPNLVKQIGPDISKMGAHYHDGIDDAESTKRAQEFIDMYLAGGASVCELVNDIQTARWEKLLWNGTFNTVCALMRMDVGELQRSKARESILLPMMWEIWHIAKAANHPMPEPVVNRVAYRLPDDCPYRPSMLLDLENERPMELEVILGNPLRMARELGVEVPNLDMIYRLLKIEEWKYSK